MASKFDQNFCEIRFYLRLSEGDEEAQKIHMMLKDLLNTQETTKKGKKHRGKQQ